MNNDEKYNDLYQKYCDLNDKLSSVIAHRSLITNAYDETSGTYSWDSGSTAWMLTSTALVLFMTLPGLILFYVGMVRTKNVVATCMQIFSICCLITFLWLCFGYSLAFTPVSADRAGSRVYGDASRFWLRGMTLHSVHQAAPLIPETVYCMYQLTFAIITPALMCGSFADRMKYWPMMVFMGLWHLLVYCPIAHSVFHPDGFLFLYLSLDYAGGSVVHISSGMGGLVASIILGHRHNYGKEIFEPHNIMFTAIGTCMLWVGWFGFNAGSAVNSLDGRAGMAMINTHISAAIAALSWMLVEFFVTKQPKLVSMLNGAVAGLVTITPACGFVDPTGAFFIGLIAGPVCYGGSNLKHYFGYDDALDAFGIHGVGGITGGLLAGLFASRRINGVTDGLFYARDGGVQLAVQLFGIVVCMGWSLLITSLILLFVDATMGLRVSEAEEIEGIDSSFHGESLEKKEVVEERRFAAIPTDAPPQLSDAVEIEATMVVKL